MGQVQWRASQETHESMIQHTTRQGGREGMEGNKRLVSDLGAPKHAFRVRFWAELTGTLRGKKGTNGPPTSASCLALSGLVVPDKRLGSPGLQQSSDRPSTAWKQVLSRIA